jgi:hypothetical protein
MLTNNKIMEKYGGVEIGAHPEFFAEGGLTLRLYYITFFIHFVNALVSD